MLRNSVSCLFVVALVVALRLDPELQAQSGNIEPAGRAEEIQELRIQKAAAVRPDKPRKIEKYFDRVQEVLQRSPVQFGVGGLGPGAGFAIGSHFEWNSSGDRVRSNLWGHASINRFYAAGTGVELPHVGGRDLSFALEGLHSDAPQLEYYGSGPDSAKGDRTNYRREDTLFQFRIRFRPQRRLTPACRVGGLLLNVGPGTNDRFATTESAFGPDQAPGVDVQSDFLVAGCSIDLDLRDFPLDPYSGTYAGARYDRYSALDFDRFSFHRLTAAAEQYIPFLNQKRVIALLARTEFSWHSGDQVVPFYLQSTLGSDQDLRGFRRYRFYDENSIALTAEYRWEVGMRFEMALFVDSGKVFHKPSEISLTGLETSAGFGVRIKNVRSVALRLDTGFSREGVQVWLKLGTLF
jgi:hypothetical protein